MASKHKRNDARSKIENPGWESLNEALKEIREASLFGRESILNKLRQHKIYYDQDECPGQSEQDADAVLECLKQIEQISFFLIERQSNDSNANQKGELLQLRSLSKMNEQNLLIAYRGISQLCESMAGLYQLIQQTAATQPLTKSYKNLHECVNSLLSTLNNYRSSNEDFVQEKQFWASKNSATLENTGAGTLQSATIAEETEHGSSQVSEKAASVKVGVIGQKASEKSVSVITYKDEVEHLRLQRQQLLGDIAQLEEMLRVNNDEFAEEVQKYNRILYQQQEELKDCQRAIRSLEGRVYELEESNVSLREQRFKDELMIENMTKKLRLQERERVYPRELTIRGARSNSPNSSLHTRMDLMHNGLRSDVFYQRGYKADRPTHFQQQYQH